jgi:molybdenum cofactor synthesis domain-containing protein
MIQVAILTISDSASAGTREDLSGPALRKRCEALGWPVLETATAPDSETEIVRRLSAWADGGLITLILTTGGTGISARDSTPEATRTVIERELPGIAELMRSKGLEQTPFSVLSRGIAGTRKRTLIVNLPGSPKGALYSFAVIEGLAVHVIKLLGGETEH